MKGKPDNSIQRNATASADCNVSPDRKKLYKPPIPLMSTDKEKPIYKEESDLLIGCAIEVHNEIGYGFHEKPYENALVVEFQH
jgi:hypothetical protein